MRRAFRWATINYGAVGLAVYVILVVIGLALSSCVSDAPFEVQP